MKPGDLRLWIFYGTQSDIQTQARQFEIENNAEIVSHERLHRGGMEFLFRVKEQNQGRRRLELKDSHYPGEVVKCDSLKELIEYLRTLQEKEDEKLIPECDGHCHLPVKPYFRL